MVLSSWRKLVRQIRRSGKAALRGKRAGLDPQKSTQQLLLEQLEDRTLMTVASVFQWTGANGAWNNASSWTLISGPSALGYPDAQGDVAQFTGSPAITNVALPVPITVGEIDFGTSQNILINPTGGALILDNTGFGNGVAKIVALTANTGTDTIDAQMSAINLVANPTNPPSTPFAATIGGGTVVLSNAGGNNAFNNANSSFTVNSGGNLTVASASNTGTAPITVNNGGELAVNSNGTLGSTPTVTVNTGGTFQVTDNSTNGPIERFGGNSNYSPNTDTNINLNGGTFQYIGNSGGASSDNIGTIDLTGGNSLISMSPTGGGTVNLTANSLVRAAGATVTFSGVGLGTVTNALTDTASNELLFNTAPKTEGNSTFDHIGILPYASINGTDFATYQVQNNTNDPTLVGISTFNDYALSIASANPGDTVKETGSEVLSGNTQINGLILTNAASISQAGFSLTIGSNTFTDGTPNTGSSGYGGGILNFNVVGGTLSGGTLSFAGTGEGIILNGLVPGEVATNFYNVPNVSNGNNNGYGGNVLGTFNQFSYTNTVPTAQRVDPEINYPNNGNGVFGSGGTAGGITSAGGNGQPVSNLPAAVVQATVAVQWTGYLNVVQGGLYSIINNTTDDDSQTFIDGQLVIYGTWQGNQAFNVGAGLAGNVYAASVNLTPGLHSILTQYFNAGGTGGEVIEYQGPDTGGQLVVVPGAANLNSPGFVATGQVNILSTITGANSLTIAGGQVNFPTANSYTGPTYVNGANIDVGNNLALGTGTLNLVSGFLQSSASVTLANPFTLNNSTLTFVSANNLTLSGNGTLAGNTSIIEHSTARIVLSGALSDAAGTTGGLTISQSGNAVINAVEAESGVALTGASTYSGGTTLLSGSLIVGSATSNNAITPLGSGPVTLSGGTLFVDSQTRTLANPVVLNGSVSISTSAFGNSNNSSTSSSLTFSGAATIASNSSISVTGTTTFSSASSISGTGQLTVTGQGTLTLAGSAANFSGGTVLNAGVFGAFGTVVLGNSGALGTGPITFVAGQLQGSVPLTIANQLTFTSGSYAAFAGSNSIAFTNTTPNVNTLTGTVNLVVNTPTTFNEVLADGTTSGSLALFSGTSTLTLTAADTFSGSTIVNGGTLILKGAGALTQTNGVTIDAGAVVTLDNTTASGGNVNDRINSNAINGLTMAGGTLSLLGGSGVATSESYTILDVYSGNSNIITTTGTGVSPSVAINFTTVTRVAGATTNFQAGQTGSLQSLGTSANEITFSAAPTLTPAFTGILPWATVTDSTGNVTVVGGSPNSVPSNGYNLATIGANGVTALTTYQALSTTGGNTTSDNVLVTATPAAGIASESVNSLFMNGVGINISGFTPTTGLTVLSGTVASTGGTTTGNTLTVPVLNFGNTLTPAEGIIFTNTGSDTVASRITGTQGLTMSGPGNLILPNANSYSAPTSYDEVQILTLPASTATAGTFTVSFNGTTSAAIGFNANANSGAGSVQTILQAMNTIGANNVLVQLYQSQFGEFQITFVNGLGGQVLPLLTITNNLAPAGLTITNVVSQIGTSATAFNGGTLTIGTNTAIQQGLSVTSGTIQSSASVALAGAVSFGVGTSNPNILPSSGNITVGGSQPIVFSGGVVLNGLESGLNVTNTAATIISGTIGSNPLLANVATNPNGTLYTTAFIKEGPGTLTLTATNNYTGVTWIQQGIVNINKALSFGVSGAETQTVNITGTITGGFFTLTFNGDTTGLIPWVIPNPSGDVANNPGSTTGLSTADLQTMIQGAIDTLPNIGPGNAVVQDSGTYSSTGASNFSFTIAFQNQLAGQVLPLVTVNNTLLPGSLPVVTLTTPGNAVPAVVVGTAGLPATLQFQTGSGGQTYPYRFTVAGSGVTVNGSPLGVINGYDGNNTIGGTINILSASTFGGTFPVVISGAITGGGDITKVGSGRVVFEGLNTWTGGLTIAQGDLQSDIYSSALGLNVSGVTVLSGATLEIGAGAAISGKPLTINGSGFGLVQLSTELAPAGAVELIRATQGTVWSGDIFLASNATIDANNASNNSSTSTSNIFPFAITGVISGPGNLTKTGLSPLTLEAANAYPGTTTIAFGGFILSGTGTLASSTLTVDNTASFTLDNSYTVLPNRFNGNLTLDGGAFNFLPNNTAGIQSTASLGTITLAAGQNTISNAVGTGGANITTITALSLVRLPGATVSFSQATTGTAINQFLFTNAPTNLLLNGIFPWATVNGGSILQWGTYVIPTLANPVGGFEAYTNYVTSLATATSTSNVELTNATQLSSNITVNSVLVVSTSSATTLNLQLGTGTTNYTLAITSGGLMTTGAGSTSFLGGTINFGSAEGLIMGGSSDTIGSTIAGTDGVTDSNTATVTFGSTLSGGAPSPTATGNTYSGPATAGAPATTQNAGTLLVDTVSSLGSGPVLLYGGSFGTGVGGGNFAIGNQLELANSVVTLGSTNSVTFVGPILLTNMNELTISNAVVFAGVIKDANYPTVTGGLALVAGNALIINNSLNTYSGGTILGGNQGTNADLQLETSDVSVNAIEALSFTGGPTSGTFSLSFGSSATGTYTTTPITYSSVASTLQSNIQSALNGLLNIGLGGTLVSVSSASLATITFQGTLAGAVEPAFLVTSSLNTGSVSVVTAPATNAGTGLPSLAGTTGLSGTKVGGVASGPLGIGTFYLFGSGGEGFPGGLNGSQNGGFLSVANSNSSVTSAQVVPAVTLHSQVVMFNSNFQMGGGLYNGGGNITLAGPLSLQGNNDFYIINNQTLTVSGQISGDGSVMLFGDQNYTGILDLSGDNAAWSGGVTNWAFNTLEIGNNQALGSGLYDWPGGLLQDDGNGGPAGYTLSTPMELDNGGKTNNIAVSAGSTLTLTGTIIGAGPLQKIGGGNLVITNSVVQTGRDTVSDGTLTLSGGGAIAQGNSIVVNPNATLTLDNSGINSGNRIGDAIPITLNGGTLNFIGNNASFSISSETIGSVTLGAGDSTISLTSGTGTNATSTLNIGNIIRTPGAILSFVGINSPIGPVGTTFNQVNIQGQILNNLATPTSLVVPTTNSVNVAADPGATNPADYSAFVPFATVSDSSGFDFVGVPVSGTVGLGTEVPVTPTPATPYVVQHYADYVTGGLTTSEMSTDVVELQSTDPAGSDAVGIGGQNVAGVLLYGDNVGNFSGGAGGIDSSGNVLTVGVTNSAGTVGSIIATSGTSAPVVGDVFPAISVLSFPAEALLISNTSSGLQMDGNIDTGGIAGTSSLTLGGTGVIALAGANSLSANPTLTSGTLILHNNLVSGNFAAFGAATNTFNITGGTLQSGDPSGVIVANPVTDNLGTGLTLNNNSGTTTDTYPDSSNLAFLQFAQEGFTISGPDPLTLTGLISGPGGITVNTTSTVTFADSASNTYQGNTTVNLGTLALASTSTSTTATGGGAAALAGNLFINSENLTQTLTFSASTATSGSFQLQFGTLTTAAISYSTTASTLQSNISTALTALGSIGSGNVSVNVTSATSVTITFINALAGSTLSGQTLAVVGGNSLAPATTIATALAQAGGPGIVNQTGANNELTYVQTNPNTITFNANVTISGSGSLILGATSAQLGSLTFVNGGNVTMASTGTLTLINNIQTQSTNGQPSSATIKGGNLLLTSSSAINTTGANLGKVISVAASETVGSNGLEAVGGPSQVLSFANGTTAGNFTLSFQSVPPSTGPVNFSTNSTSLQSNIQAALNAISTIAGAGGATVAVTGDTNAVQTLTFSGAPTGGTFTLGFGTATTSAITYSTATGTLASNIQAALNALSTIGLASFGTSFSQANVSVSASGSTVTINFQNTLGVQSVPSFVPGPTNISGVISTLTPSANNPIITAATTKAGAAPVATITFPNSPPGTVVPAIVASGVPVNTVQVVSLPGSATTGSFILSFNSQTTLPISYSTNLTTLAGNVNNALNSLTTLGANNDIQTLTFSSTPTSGTFALAFANGVVTATTGAITYSSTAATLQANIQNALNALATVATVNAFPTNTTNVSVSAGSATSVTITFQNALGGINATLLAVPAAANLLVPSTTITPAISITGGPSIANLTSVTAVNASTVDITFQNADGGAVSSFPTTGQNGLATTAVQQITVPTAVSGGTFSLVFAGLTSAPVTYSGTATSLASNIQSALNSLLSSTTLAPGGGSGTVSVSVQGSPLVATVTFTGSTANTSEPTITAVSNGNAVQTVVFPGTPTGGFFTLVYSGATTAPIAFSSVTATLTTNVQNALNALSSLGATNDVETLNFSASPAGTFRLTYNGSTTGLITYTTVAASLATNVLVALDSLPTINANGGVGTNSANVAVSAANASTVNITFQNALGGANQALLFTASAITTGTLAVTHTSTGAAFSGNTAVTATSPTTVNVTFQGVDANQNITSLLVPTSGFAAGTGAGTASNTQQQINFTGVTGGTFTLAFGASTTAPIVFSTVPATLGSSIQLALSQLANIGAGNVSVSAVAGSSMVATVTFVGTLAGAAEPALTIGGTAPVSGLQTITFPGNPSSGQFNLAFINAGQTLTTGPITFSANATTLASNVETALAALANIGGTANVTTSPNTTNINGSIDNVNVTFQGALGGGVVQNALFGNAIGISQVNAQQNVALTIGVTGGSFTVTINGITTPPIAWSSNLTTLAANAQAALNTALGSGNTQAVALTSTSININFIGALAGANETVTQLAANIGSGASATAIQSISFTGNLTSGGTFTVAAGTSAPVSVTYSTNPSTLEANLQSALNSFANIGLNNSAVVVNPAANLASITYLNAFVGAATPALTVTSLGGSNPTATLTNLVVGQGLLPNTDQAIVVTTPQLGRATTGITGLIGGNGLVSIVNPVFGSGVTGTSPTASVLGITAVGAQGGLTGGSSLMQAYTSPVTALAAGVTGPVFGFGLNVTNGVAGAGTTLTSATIVAGGQGGLAGGNTTAAAAQGTSSGLSGGGSNPLTVPAGLITTGFGGDLIISSVVQGTGSGPVVKDGPGSLSFAGTLANTIASPLIVDSGSLVLSMQGKVNAYSGAVVINGYSSASVLQVNSPFTNQLNPSFGIFVNGAQSVLDVSSSTAASQSITTLDIRGGTVKTGSNSLTLASTLTGLPAATSGGVQSATITGNLVFATTQSVFGADVSGVPGLLITGVISGAGGITKYGTGTVELNGTSSNTYTGTTTINEGTLLLQSTATPIPGNVTIGDNAGGSGFTKSDLLTLGASNQIATGATITINNSGQFNLNGFNQTIGGLTMIGGTVTTGTGTLTLGGNVQGQASSSNQTAATIAGTVSATGVTTAGTLALGTATRNFDIQQGNLPGAIPDMIINANISGATGGLVGLTKTNNAGVLDLLGVNTYTGPTTVNSGTLLVDGSVGESFNEIQTITFTGSPGGGTFTLAFGSATTLPITYNSTSSILQSNIQTALNALGAVGTGNVTVVANSGTSVTLTFIGTLAGQNLAPVVVASSSLTGGTSPNLAVAVTTTGFTNSVSVNDLQTLTFGGTPTAGTFVLTYGGATTAPITYSSVTGTLGTSIAGALNSLSSLGASNDVQTLTFGSAATGGTFALSFSGSTTASINYSTTASVLQSNIQAALNALANITTINGVATSSNNAVVSAANATSVSVTFQNALGGLNASALSLSVQANGLLPTATLTSAIAVTGGPAPNVVSVTAASATSVTVTFVGQDGGQPIGNLGSVTSLSPSTAGLSVANTTPGFTSGGSVNAIQTLTFNTPTTTITGGLFTLAFNSQTTTPISYSSVSSILQANIQNALNALSTIAGGDVVVNANSATSVTLSFVNLLGGVPVATLSEAAALYPIALTINGGPTGGTFTLTYNGTATQNINYSTTATALQSNILSALNSLSTIGTGNVAVTANSGTSVNVTFTGTLANLVPQTALTASTSFSGGSSTGISVSTSSLSVATTVVGFTSGVVVTGTGAVLGGQGTTGPIAASATGGVNPGPQINGTAGSGIGIVGGYNLIGVIGTTASTDLTNAGNLTLQISGYGTAGTSFDQINETGLGIIKIGPTSTLTLDLNGITNDGTAAAVVTFQGIEGKFNPANITTVDNPLGLLPVVKYQANEIDITFAGPAKSFVIVGNASTVAGQGYTATVEALDQFGNPALSYAGTIHFSTTDTNGLVSLPADYTFTPSVNGVGDGGIHVFTGLTLITATKNGSTPTVQTLTVKDTTTGQVTSGITGNSLLTVLPAVATHFVVSAPANIVAGQFLVIGVTAEDQYGNTATGYSGTVHFSSTDAKALLQTDSTLTNGVGSFAAIFETAGGQSIEVQDTTIGLGFSGITGFSNPTTLVSPSVANHFQLVGPSSSVTPNVAFNLTVTVQDSFGNTVTGYSGTIHFSPTNAQTALPADYTFGSGDAGTHVFSGVIEDSAPIDTITATDTANANLKGSTTVSVNVATPSKFIVQDISAATSPAGSAIVISVEAVDPFGNEATSYTGTVHFTSTDPQDVLTGLPADYTFTSGVNTPSVNFNNGIAFFAVILKTAGPQTVTATDTQTNTINGTSPAVTVTNLVANHFAVTTPASAITGTPFTVSIAAEDAFNNIVHTYTGTVHFSSTAASSALPADSTLTSGTGNFTTVMLNTAGSQTITVKDTTTGQSFSGITGSSNTITTRGLTVTSLTQTPSGFVVTFNKPFNPGVSLYDASGTNGPDDALLTSPNSPQISFHGSIILSGNNTTVTFVKTSLLTSPNFNPVTGVLTATTYPATYTVTLRSAANGFRDSLGAPLDGLNNGSPAGSNYVATFVVSAPPVVVGLPSFARGPDSNDAVNVPAGATTAGIPINVSNGTGVTSGKFTLQYNSALLTISGATVNSSLAGASLSLDAASTPGTAVLDFSSPTPLATSTAVVRLGGLVAFVPNSTVPLYKSKALLHWTSVQLNSGSITSEGDDAIQVVAYLGDTNGDGTLSGGDGALISSFNSFTNSSTGTLGGFAAYGMADPTIIGDLNNNGNADSADVTLLNSFLSGTPHAQIPVPPAALAGFTVTGPDPALSLPTTLQAALGGTIVVPVNIDNAHPDGSTGATDAVLALKYNPQVFTVTPADIQLGSLPAAVQGWQLTTVVNPQTGEIGIDMFGSNPILSTASGSMVLISLHVRDTAPVGSTGLTLVTQVNPTGQRAFVTTMADGQGALVLHTAMTATGTEPGSPGLVTITGGQSVLVSGPAQVEGNQSTADAGQAVVTGVSDQVVAVHSQLPAAYLQQVFGDIDPMLAQESMIAQPAAILNTDLNEQTSVSGQDKAMLQPLADTQHDWAPAELLEHFGQAGHDGVTEDDLAGLEAFFAREASETR